MTAPDIFSGIRFTPLERLPILVNEPSAFALDDYLRAVAACTRLSDIEQAALSSRIADGDDAAVVTLVHANLYVVVLVARKYVDRGLALQQLIDLGNIGLVRGALRWRSSAGSRFISYVVWHIRHAILLGLDGRLQSAFGVLASVSLWDTRWWKGLYHDAQLAVFDEKRPLSLETLFEKLEPLMVTLYRCAFGIADESVTTFEELGRRLGWSQEDVQRAQQEALRMFGQEKQ